MKKTKNGNSIELSGQHARRFLAGYPWIYSNEILKTPGLENLTPGSLVQVIYQKNPIAVGYYNRHSLISFRVLNRNPEEIIDEVDEAFFIDRFQRALKIRERYYSKPYYRLIHAESDGLPGLVIDRFGDDFRVQINTAGMDLLKEIIAGALQTLFAPQSICFLQDSSTRALEKLAILEPEWIGKRVSKLDVVENEIPFDIAFDESFDGLQKTGWFYDHRENRALIAKYAKNKTLIDYYCYCGALSIQAAKAGAKKVVGVDRSAHAIHNAVINAKNLMTDDDEMDDRCEFKVNDVFKDMDERIQNNERFDIVVVDPPAFVKSKKDLAVGLKGYIKLLIKAARLTAGEGLLGITSCSYHVSESDLKACLAEALHKAGRNGRIIHRLMAGPDHPVLPGLPESEYLKGFLVALD